MAPRAPNSPPLPHDACERSARQVLKGTQVRVPAFSSVSLVSQPSRGAHTNRSSVVRGGLQSASSQRLSGANSCPATLAARACCRPCLVRLARACCAGTSRTRRLTPQMWGQWARRGRRSFWHSSQVLGCAATSSEARVRSSMRAAMSFGPGLRLIKERMPIASLACNQWTGSLPPSH